MMNKFAISPLSDVFTCSLVILKRYRFASIWLTILLRFLHVSFRGVLFGTSSMIIINTFGGRLRIDLRLSIANFNCETVIGSEYFSKTKKVINCVNHELKTNMECLRLLLRKLMNKRRALQLIKLMKSFCLLQKFFFDFIKILIIFYAYGHD